MDKINRCARRYSNRRGWKVIPLRYRSKIPAIKNWQAGISPHELKTYLNSRPHNLGILTGTISGGLVDIDLDHPKAVELANQYLPPTGSVFGRASKPASHWLYTVDTPPPTKRWQTKEGHVLLEFRSDRCQTMVPPSVHTNGEESRWKINDPPEPVAADALLAACHQLALAVAQSLGETLEEPSSSPSPHTATLSYKGDPERAWLHIQQLPDAIAGQGGHNVTFNAACECFRFGLTDENAWEVLQRFNAEKCDPKWTDYELRHKRDDACAASRPTERWGYGPPFLMPAIQSRQLVLSSPGTIEAMTAGH